jgi:carbonic anhydrase
MIFNDNTDKVNARTYKDIPEYHHDQIVDYGGMAYLQMKEQQYAAEAFPSMIDDDGGDNDDKGSASPAVPSNISYQPTSTIKTPTNFPLFENTVIPTIVPITKNPTRSPTIAPTIHPTTAPITVPPSTSPTSKQPTSVPTIYVDPFAPVPVPINPDSWYFNYDNSTNANYGPGELGLIEEHGKFYAAIKNNRWGDVKTPPNTYWQEFLSNGLGPWKNTFDDNSMFSVNSCQDGKLQSPIDLRENEKCQSSHEIRSLRGDYKMKSNDIQKQIHSNKLRLLYNRRPCSDWNDPKCQEPDPPHADFPNGWGGYADVLHIDIKIPSEHSINGEKFDAEMQIFHLHSGKKRFPIQSVLIRAVNDTRGYNYYFQAVLDEFQFEYNKNAFRCGILHPGRRKTRLLESDASNDTWYDDNNTSSILTDYSQHHQFHNNSELKQNRRHLSIPFNSVWDPYHPMLIPSIWFYRYDGSFTEPPCTEVVTWFVADQPMIINFAQLEQLKLILFTNVDTKCHKTSVQFGRSVARPLRQSNNRPVQRCTATHYGPDPV